MRRDWCRGHPDRKYQADYSRTRRQTDPAFKIKDNLHRGIRALLAGEYRAKKVLFLLGCSVEEFKNYLGGLFKPGMTWDNRGLGGWEVDCKMPCVCFDLTSLDDQKKCFHYSNLQPLWRDENSKKETLIS
jgi:hypothetical protein